MKRLRWSAPLSRLGSLLLGLLCLAVASCADDDDAPLDVSPSHGSLFGNEPITLTLHQDIGRIVRVTIAGAPAYDLQEGPYGATSVVVRPQGAPLPGPAEVLLEGTTGTLRVAGAYTFDAPAPGAPVTWMAFGASFTMGVQSDGIDPHSQTHGVAAQTARAAGAYLGLPLLKPSFLPPDGVSSLNADCSPRAGGGDLVTRMIQALTDPQTGQVSFARSRIDPAMMPRNVAVGGARLHDVLHPAGGQVRILEHMVESPTGDLGAALQPVDKAQIERIEALDPDIGLSADIIGNDVLIAALDGDDLRPDQVTKLGTIKADIAELTARLGKLHGHYFMANLPSLTLLPNVATVRAKRLAAGTDTAQSFDQKAAELDALIDTYNQAVADAMGHYPNLHVVDFRGEVAKLRSTGLQFGGEHLSTAAYGGFLSLDQLHLTDTGYAIYANAFIAAINGVLQASIPLVDLVAVHALDALSPTVLAADGLMCVPPH